MKARNSPGVPVSTVGSSSRLSQLNSPHGLRSHASTPNYQMSSLNPAVGKANQDLKDQQFEEQFNELKVVKVVKDLEDKLVALSSKVGSFDSLDLDENIQSILEIDQDLKNQINELHHHQRLGATIKELETESNTLNSSSRNILKKLIEFRSELKSLPSLPTKEVSNEETMKDLNVDEVLKYGMKLAKFTKVPPTAAASHPNNFVWPAEDSLRRGMLALASLKSDEILQNEIGERKQVSEEPKQIEVETKQPEQQTSDISSIRSSKSKRKTEKTEEAASSLNLDLFDPENEDDSD